jgi:hypothetical protein
MKLDLTPGAYKTMKPSEGFVKKHNHLYKRKWLTINNMDII